MAIAVCRGSASLLMVVSQKQDQIYIQSAISRCEEWKLKASKEDRKREAKLQGIMSDESYLPTEEELQE